MTQRILAAVVGVTLVSVVVVALLGLGVVALAQGGAVNSCAGCELAASGTCAENAVTVTVTGVVSEIRFGPDESALLLDEGGQVPIQVVLAPSWYLETVGFAAQVDDRLVVTGHYNADGTSLVAHTVASESTGQTFAFCDEGGHSLWADVGCNH